MRPGSMVPPKTLYNRWTRWGDLGVFARMAEELASGGTAWKTVLIDATLSESAPHGFEPARKKRGA